MPSALRSARAASEVATAATASQAQASASASRQQMVAASMSASRQQASSQQTELDEIRAMSTGMARDHILELKKELVDIKLLEEMSKKDIRARVLNTAAIIDNRP